jgi:hypothetical protein
MVTMPKRPRFKLYNWQVKLLTMEDRQSVRTIIHAMQADKLYKEIVKARNS